MKAKSSHKPKRKRNRTNPEYIAALEDYIGNGRRESQRSVATRYGISHVGFNRMVLDYQGRGFPVTLQITQDGQHKEIDTVQFWIDELS
jgi:hypothetical protein